MLCLGYNLNKLHAKIQNEPDREPSVFDKKCIEKNEKPIGFIKVRKNPVFYSGYREDTGFLIITSGSVAPSSILQTATFCGQQGRISRPVRAILSGQF